MRINVIFREENENIKLSNMPLNDVLNVSFQDVQSIGNNDYNKLKNIPSINSIILQGAITAEDLGLGRVYYDTTINWNSKPNLIAEKGTIYIYSDYKYIQDEHGENIPVAGIRIGDGVSYLIDMPFMSDVATYLITSHISNTTAHVTGEDREFWDNKVSAYIKDGELVFSKTSYEVNGVIIDR